MKRTVINTLTLSLLAVLTINPALATDEAEQEHKQKLESLGLTVPEAVPDLQQNESIIIRATSKPYTGFQGIKVTPKPKQYSDGPDGAAQELLDNWDDLSIKDAGKAQEKLNALIRDMSYQELKDLYEAHPENFIIENALYQSWLLTQRSGENGFRVSRSSATETEPNDDMSSANAVSTDTVSAYLTAYDEDWYSITVSGGGDWTLETHATTADDNAGDTKMFLYADTSDVNDIDDDDDGGSGSYSKIARRFETADAGTYYVKVTGYSSTTAGAYLLTASSTSLPAAYGNVVINEIHYNPASSQGSDSDYEFLELYNTSASDVDLHGMTVGEVGSTTNIASLDSVTIGAGSYVVVAYTGATYSSLTVPVVDNDGYFGLSNSGKALELIDSTGALVDNVTYDDYAPWPNYTGPDGGGPSLELIDASADNNDASNWRGWGITGGTPGAANSTQPDLSMGASITSYQAVATSAAGTFQLNNNGDADLTVTSVTVDSTYVPGSEIFNEDFETDPPTGWTFENEDASDAGFVQSSTAYHSPSYSFKHNDNNLSSAADSWMISPSITLGSADVLSLWYYQTGSSYYDYSGVWISTASNDPLTNPSDFTELQELSTFAASWTEYTADLSAYSGQTVYIGIKYTGDWAHDLYIDDVTVNSSGTTIATTWLSATAPAAIAAGDSGDISLTFDGTPFASDTTLTATVNVLNNDPQDSADTFTATMVVRGDTAIVDLTTASYIWNPSVAGDSTGSSGTVTIQNDGGADLVLDSVGYAIGTHWYDDAVDGTVIESNETANFKVYYYPQTSGIHRDTLVVHANTDSSSAGAVTMTGVGYDASTDTSYGYTDMKNNWPEQTNYSSYGSYFYSSSGHLISPYSAIPSGASIFLKAANTSSTTDAKFRIYFSSDKSATQWSGWTLLDSVEIAAATANYDYYEVDLGFTSADTGHIAIRYTGGYNGYLDKVIMPKETDEPAAVSTTPEGYTLEGFESSVPPAEWTLINDGDANGWVQYSGGNTGSYSAAISYSSTAHDDWLITPQMSIEAGDSITLYAKNQSSSWTELFNVMVSTASTDKADFTATLASSVGPPTSWTYLSYDLSAYAGSDIYVGFQAISTNEYRLFLDDVLIPWVLPPTAELSHSAALDFHMVAVDTAAGTGSQALSTDIINTGQDTLRGSIASGSAVFTISSDTVDLAPGDTLALTVTYAPTAVGDDSSGITFYTNSGGAADTSAISVEGSAIEADTYEHFEFADYETAGFLRYNTAGGVYWKDASGTGSSGSGYVTAGAHKWGGSTWLVLPTYTADADGERLSWDMKVDDASPTAATTVYVMKLSGNTYADLASATALDSHTVSSSADDITTSWASYFYDDYLNPSDLGNSLNYALKYVDSDDAANSTADGATVSIDNISFANAPSVPIVIMSGTQDNDVVLVADGLELDDLNLAQNLGGDTLVVDSIWTTDANLTVTLAEDTIPKQSFVTADVALDADSIVMGAWSAYVHFTHNDTFVSTGHDSLLVKADFAGHFENFEEDDLGTLLSRDKDGDGHGWTTDDYSSLDAVNGDFAAYSNKATSAAIGENALKTRLHDVVAGDKLIFYARYTSSSDPDWMRILVSNDLGATWTGLDTVNMMGKTTWARYEYDLASYVGDVVRFAIVDLNYGNSINDKLWIDRVMLPARAAIGTIASYRTMNADSTYAWEDSVFTIRGVVTAAGSSFGSSGPSYVQDSTAGIAVYDSDFADTASVGDEVILKGTADTYANALQLEDVSFIIADQNVAVDPELVSLSDLSGTSGEALEGQFVKVEDVTWVDESDWGTSSFNMEVTDGTDTATVRIDSDADIDNMPLGSLDIMGVIGQYSWSDAYDGFQLLPRGQDDLTGYHRISGNVTDASTGAALTSVAVALGEAVDTTGSDGSYSVRELGDWSSITFSKSGYTDATFSVNILTGGFDTLNVAMYYSPDSLVLSNGFEVDGSEGDADTSVAAETQWFVSSALEVHNYNSSTASYDTITISPSSGDNMLIATESGAAGGSAYASNSYSLWVLPEVVDLTGGDDLNDHTLSMDVWSNAETNYDDFRVLVKSDADTTDTWNMVAEIRGGYGDGWEELVVDLGPVDDMDDARIGLLFDSDASVVRGFGYAVDNIEINGRDMFMALAPANLEAESMLAGQVDLTWGAPGTDSTTLNVPTIQVSNFLDVDAIVAEINAHNPTISITSEEWLADMRAQNPRFNTHPRVENRAITYMPHRNLRSRDLVGYNVMRRGLGEDWVLVGSSNDATYSDNDVTDYTYYYYQVSAVYDEGESDPTAEVMGVPGAITNLEPDLVETFETVSTGETLPSGWSTVNDGVQEVDWMVGDDGSIGSYSIPDHSDYAYIDGSDYSSGQNVKSALVSSFYDFSDAEGAILTFDSYGQDYANYTTMDVAYRQGYGEWVVLKDMGHDHSAWESIELFVGEEIVGKDYVQIGFLYDDGSYYNYGWAIDNVQLMDKRAVASLSIDSVSIVNTDDSDTDSLTFTISNTGDWTLNYSISFDAGGENADGSLRDITGSTLTPSQDYYSAGENDIILTLYNNSTDVEYLDTVTATFPTGVAVNSSSNFTVSTYSFLEATVEGQTITWADTDGSWGEITGGTSVTCTVNVNIGSALVDGGMTVDYTISGDDYGSEPHDIAGSFTVPVLPIGVHITPSSGSINAGRSEDVTIHVTYGGPGILTNDIVITTTDLNQSEIHLPTLIRTVTPPAAFDLRMPADGDTISVAQETDTLTVSWTDAEDPDGDLVSYMLYIDGLPLAAGMDGFEFVDTLLSADMVDTTGLDFDFYYQAILAELASIGATPTYFTVEWDVDATDGMDTTTSSNGPFTATLDLGWLMGTDDEPAIPDVFSLQQNYPNPFNPVTTIRYDVPEMAMVTMEVYDILGRKVRTLVNHRHQPGYHAVIWNGLNDKGVPVSTGMYFYRITAEGTTDNFVSVKKLIMMK